MKRLLLLMLVLSAICCKAQTLTSGNSLFLLKSKTSEVKIKADKPVKIKTVDGHKIRLEAYTFLGDSMIASATDTVYLKDITKIKGKVKGSAVRKIGGGLVAGTGYYFAVTGYVVGTVAVYPPALLLILPSAGVAYTGHRLAGARYFDTTQKWTLSIAK